MGFYDYSFNNNYLLFQNPPTTYNNFEYPAATPSTYHDYNPLPSALPNYNHFSPATSPAFGTSYRHSTPSSFPEISKFTTQSKTESTQVSNSDSISMEKLQSIINNTSEHVQELNQMCQVKEPKEFDKSSSSKFRINFLGNISIKLTINLIRRFKSPRHVVFVLWENWKSENKEETANPFLSIPSC